MYEVVDTPREKKHIENRCILMIKEDDKGNALKYKARWVVKRYMKCIGLYYDLTYAPVSRLSNLRVIRSLAVKLNLKIHQLDVNTAFMNKMSDEEIYVKTAPGFKDLIKERELPCFLLLTSLLII